MITKTTVTEVTLSGEELETLQLLVYTVKIYIESAGRHNDFGNIEIFGVLNAAAVDTIQKFANKLQEALP